MFRQIQRLRVSEQELERAMYLSWQIAAPSQLRQIFYRGESIMKKVRQVPFQVQYNKDVIVAFNRIRDSIENNKYPFDKSCVSQGQIKILCPNIYQLDIENLMHFVNWKQIEYVHVLTNETMYKKKGVRSKKAIKQWLIYYKQEQELQEIYTFYKNLSQDEKRDVKSYVQNPKAFWLCPRLNPQDETNWLDLQLTPQQIKKLKKAIENNY